MAAAEPADAGRNDGSILPLWEWTRILHPFNDGPCRITTHGSPGSMMRPDGPSSLAGKPSLRTSSSRTCRSCRRSWCGTGHNLESILKRVGERGEVFAVDCAEPCSRNVPVVSGGKAGKMSGWLTGSTGKRRSGWRRRCGPDVLLAVDDGRELGTSGRLRTSGAEG